MTKKLKNKTLQYPDQKAEGKPGRSNESADGTSGLRDKAEKPGERSQEYEMILKHRKGTFGKCGALSKDHIF